MKNSIARIWLGLFLGDALLHLVSTQMGDAPYLLLVSKGLLMPLLMAYAVTQPSIIAPRLKRSLVCALGFSWVGDILLGLSSDLFLFGLGAFLVGHVIYIFAYGYATGTYPLKVVWRKWWYALPIVGYGCSFLAWLWPYLPADMQIPVSGYAAVLVAMLLAAAGRGKYTHPTSFLLVFVGAILFVLSDSLIAVNRFATPLQEPGLSIMATYILAQWLITAGLLRHPSPASHL